MNLANLIVNLKSLQMKIHNKNPKSPEVVISADKEGNSFGNIHPEYSFEYDKETNTLIIYPINSRFEFFIKKSR